MLRAFLASRGFVSLLAALLVVTGTAVTAIVLLDPAKKMIAYCAIMPDSIGLYEGNDVTMRGIRVGTVTGIHPEGTGVRVDFDLDAAHPLQGRATAATVSATIVANRNLAVLGTTDGGQWNPGTCLTKTITPKSITQTFNALAKVGQQLQGGDPAERDQLGKVVTALDNATKGDGPRFNETIKQLATVLRAPDASITHIGSLIDNVAVLSASVANGWGNLRQMLDGFAPILQTVNDVWGQVVVIIDSIVTLLPWLNDITTKYGEPILQLLNASVPYLDLLRANIGGLQELVDMVPAVTSALRTITDPDTRRVAIGYTPPKVDVPVADAQQLCAAINSITPERCKAASGIAEMDLTTLVLGVGGAR